MNVWRMFGAIVFAYLAIVTFVTAVDVSRMDWSRDKTPVMHDDDWDPLT